MSLAVRETSLEAYRDAVPHIRGRLARAVIEYVGEHPGCTQIDISRVLGESARKRVSECLGPHRGDLLEMGTVRIGGRAYTTYSVRVVDSGACEQVSMWGAA